ncbi:hypothetical protein [Nitrosospira multiformis]|uniref:hypothetical protein n=1 Tax=Nitrosospira multiformis TaxID=1231 RepID=UPI0002E7B6C8|nr:hypothetical protein [Nitrosospira multiformis]
MKGQRSDGRVKVFAAHEPREFSKNTSPATPTKRKAKLEITLKQFGMPKQSRLSAKWWYDEGCGMGGTIVASNNMATESIASIHNLNLLLNYSSKLD